MSTGATSGRGGGGGGKSGRLGGGGGGRKSKGLGGPQFVSSTHFNLSPATNSFVTLSMNNIYNMSQLLCVISTGFHILLIFVLCVIDR